MIPSTQGREYWVKSQVAPKERWLGWLYALVVLILLILVLIALWWWQGGPTHVTTITYSLDGVVGYDEGMITEYNTLTISVSRAMSRTINRDPRYPRTRRDYERPSLHSLVPFLSQVVLVAEEEMYVIPYDMYRERTVKPLLFRPRGPELCRWLYTHIHDNLKDWKLVSVSLTDNTGVKVKYRE